MALLFLLVFYQMVSADPVHEPQSVYDFTLKTINGEDRDLSFYKGKVLLVVNVASHCGYTPQYKGLEELFFRFKDRGFVVLGFPANNFGGQEPGTNEEIRNFCQENFGVTFEMFEKISVKGDNQHPLFKFLTSVETKGGVGDIRWNFEKFVIGRNGDVLARFKSKTEPLSDELTAEIEAALVAD